MQKKSFYCKYLKDLMREREEYSQQLLKAPRLGSALSKFGHSFFTQKRFKRNYLSDFYKRSFNGEMKSKHFKKPIYYACVRDDLVIVQLPVPFQGREAKCYSNSLIFSKLLGNISFEDWDKAVFGGGFVEGSVDRRARRVGNWTSHLEVYKEFGFSKFFSVNKIFRTVLDIGGLEENPKRFKIPCLFQFYRRDPRLRFAITGKPELFAGGIALIHAAAWRLEKCGNGKYIIFFCDSYYSNNKIDEYKDSFIAFLDGMLMKPTSFLEFLKEEKRFIETYMDSSNSNST